MSITRYEHYKDSGNFWLGEVPQHWTVVPIKYVSSCNDEVLEESQTEDFDIEYVEISGVHADKGVVETIVIPFSKSPSRARRKVKHGDILVSTVRTYLRAIAPIHAPPDNMIVSTGFAVIRPRSVEPGFLGYFFRSEFFISEVIARSVGVSYPAINASEMMRLPVSLPPHSEQCTITGFLDQETKKIDALIGEQEQLIALLSEKRQTIISHVVTRGLNPNAPMKDSGIQWLGEVPAHWTLCATKRLFSLVVEPAPDNNDFELLSLYTDIGVRPRRELEARGNKATTTDGYFTVKKGDIIINKLLAWMGAIGISNYDGVTSPAYDVLRPIKELEPQYYDYLFRCGICLTEFRRYSRGIMDMRLRLYFEELGQLQMPYPPIAEQQEIINFIVLETAKIDNFISEAQTAITLLKERRIALISAAVTGKIDVRGLVAVQPECETAV